MKEILTIACGKGACHLAAHYYNIQEAGFSYNPDLITDIDPKFLFREGEDRNGLQINPRFIAIDGQGPSWKLEEEEHSQVAQELLEKYGCQVEAIRDTPETKPKNEFIQDADRYYKEPNSLMQSHYDLDDVEHWFEFIFPKIHPRTFVPISFKSSEIDNKKFLSHSQGLSEWGSFRLNEDLIDNIRFFIEECDHLQGTQLISDSEYGFSGISGGLLTHLTDEYAKKEIMGVLPFNLWSRHGERFSQSIIRSFNTAMSFANFNELTSVVVPLSLDNATLGPTVVNRQFKGVNFKNTMFHKTAIMASSMDLFTLPYRLRQGESNMSSFVTSMTPYQRNFVQSLIALPFSYDSQKSVQSILGNNGLDLFDSISPYGNEALSRTLSIIATVKGFQSSRSGGGNDHFNVWADAFKRSSFDANYFQAFSTKELFRIPPSYPDIWSEDLIKSSLLVNKYGPLKDLKVANLLCNSDSIADFFGNLFNFSKKYKCRITEALVEVECDDISGIIDKVEDLQEIYKNFHLL